MKSGDIFLILIAAGIGLGAALLLFKPSSYRNAEKWEIKRDENGNLVNITVHRDAKQS